MEKYIKRNIESVVMRLSKGFPGNGYWTKTGW